MDNALTAGRADHSKPSGQRLTCGGYLLICHRPARLHGLAHGVPPGHQCRRFKGTGDGTAAERTSPVFSVSWPLTRVHPDRPCGKKSSDFERIELRLFIGREPPTTTPRSASFRKMKCVGVGSRLPDRIPSTAFVISADAPDANGRDPGGADNRCRGVVAPTGYNARTSRRVWIFRYLGSAPSWPSRSAISAFKASMNSATINLPLEWCGQTDRRSNVCQSIFGCEPSVSGSHLRQRAFAAWRAISCLWLGVRDSARARPPLRPPFRPSSTAAWFLLWSTGGVGALSSTWPVRMSPTNLPSSTGSRGRLRRFPVIIAVCHDLVLRNGISLTAGSGSVWIAHPLRP